MSKGMIGIKKTDFALLNRQRLSRAGDHAAHVNREKAVQLIWPRAALPQGTEWFKKDETGNLWWE
jgi:hypothetical protein